MKIKLFLIFVFIPFCGITQISHSVGSGFGTYKVEPTLIRDENGEKKFIGGRDIQFLNFSYEPRLILIDSILNQFSISAGLPVMIGYSQYEGDDTKTLGYGSAQVSIIGYLNWGNGSLRNNMYNRKLGLSLGFGMTYLHSGVIKKETDLIRPKNDLIKPVISYSLRYKSQQNIIWAFNIIWRLKRIHSYEKCTTPNSQFEYPTCRNVEYHEDGLLFQVKVFFGQ